MKLRWPKYLTVKRTILFALLAFAIIFALVYFFGGYKATALTDDRMPFSTEGFVDVKQYLKDEAEENEIYFKQLLSELNVANFDEKIASIQEQCKTLEYYSYLEDKLAELADEDPANEDKYTNNVSTETLISAEEHAKKTMNEFRLVLEKLDANGTGYRLYLNYFSSQFKISRVENNNEVNEWYSNPQNLTFTNNKGSTLTNQKSPIILYYYTPNGATLPYNAYEYSINDNQGDEDSPSYVDQTFSYKFDYENASLQVYYHLETKGDKYYQFPKYLTEARLNELIERNAAYVAEEAAKFANYSEKELQSYFNAHYSVKYIRKQNAIKNDPFSRIAYIGVEAYKYQHKLAVDDKNVNATYTIYTLPALFKDLTLKEKRELCEIMFRLEYEFFAKKTHKYISAGICQNDKTMLLQEYEKYEADSDPEHPYVFYELGNYTGLTNRSMSYLKQTILKKLLYTAEDLAADQALFNVEIEDTTPSFKACVQYTLTENGFEAKIINNSLYESIPDKYPIYKIEVLPYFSAISKEYAEVTGTTNGVPSAYDKSNVLGSNGQMIIPDGSGGIIELNNGKLSYQKRVYTTDLAFVDEVKKTPSEDVLLPMFAMTYDSVDFGPGVQGSVLGSSIIARATLGAPQMILNAFVSSDSDSYNRVFYAATYRESQTVTIGTGYYANPVTQVTPTNVMTDFSVEYSLINEQGLTYSDIAKRYQEMLYGTVLDQTQPDQTNSTVLNAEYLGLYDYKTNFLGIVYNGHDSLTTYSQAITVTKQLKDWGAEHINVMYLGWQKSGLVNETFNDMSFTKKLGNKDELQDMLTYFEQNDVTLYPSVSFFEVNKINESFGKVRYASRDVSNEFTEKYPYDLASGVFDKKQRAIYTISPKFFDVFSENLVKNFKDNNPSLSSMAFEKLGSKIVGDYKKRQEFFRYNSVVEQIKVFEKLEQNNISNLSLTAPYEYAVQYANNIVELPYASTLLDIFDYSIPFYQLVFSGYRDYSGMIINANDEKGLNYHIMKILETGSNIEFTFSYDDSNELIQTDYNNYYYTHYSDWAKEVTSLLTVLDTLELHKYYLASHEVVDNNTSLFKVTYKVKDECKSFVTDQEFSIYLNFSDMSANLSSVLGGSELTYIDIENSDSVYNPFKDATVNGVLNSWSCATDKEVA